MGYWESGIYAAEEWTDEEAEILRRYFTNLDGPVFALVNLPEVVKGALFARYSRTAKSLRRLFLDEFVGDLDISGDHGVDATVGLARAEQLYDRVFFEYGDDSVAQLGGVHLACEQASNLLTKVLEWGRLMSYMEKSTRYVAYDSRLPNGRYRYYRDPEILESPLGARYVGDMDRLFDAYAELLPVLQAWFAARHPKAPEDSDFAWRQSVRAKAFDALRGLLPAGSHLQPRHLRQRPGLRGAPDPHAGPPAARSPGLRRPDADGAAQGHPLVGQAGRRRRPGRGPLRIPGAQRPAPCRTWPTPCSALTPRLPSGPAPGGDPEVTLLDWDPDAEVKVVAAMLYPYTHLPEHRIQARVAAMSERRAPRRGARLRRRAGQPPPPARAGPWSGATTASTSSPTTGRSGTCSATGC